MLPRQAAFRLNRLRICITPSVVSTPHTSKTSLCRRYLHMEGPALAPVVYGGLLVALWTWKCFMMIVFQNKIIYMPGLPPNSRREKIHDYKDRLVGITWREERIRAADRTDLALCVADVQLGSKRDSHSPDTAFYILYFQGSHIPPFSMS